MKCIRLQREVVEYLSLKVFIHGISDDFSSCHVCKSLGRYTFVTGMEIESQHRVNSERN